MAAVADASAAAAGARAAREKRRLRLAVEIALRAGRVLVRGFGWKQGGSIGFLSISIRIRITAVKEPSSTAIAMDTCTPDGSFVISLQSGCE